MPWAKSFWGFQPVFNRTVRFFVVCGLDFSKTRLISNNSREIIEVFLLYWLIIRKFLSKFATNSVKMSYYIIIGS